MYTVKLDVVNVCKHGIFVGQSVQHPVHLVRKKCAISYFHIVRDENSSRLQNLMTQWEIVTFFHYFKKGVLGSSILEYFTFFGKMSA